jgi:hypothetical protein
VGFYVWKVIIPLMLIVAMSWSVFGVSPSQFALVGTLPRLAYFTILDRFIVGSTILVFLALVEAVIAVHQMDNLSRIAFPIAFGLLTLFVFSR